MNPFDWLLAGIVVCSVVRAAMRGLLQEVLSLAGVIVGLFVAAWGYRSLAAHLAGLLSSPPLADFAAFMLLLVAIIVVFSLAAKLLHRTASALGLGLLNRFFGAVFGFCRGCLIDIALLTAFTAFLPTAPWIATSLVAPYLLRAVPVVSFVMPIDLRTKLREGAERIKHTSTGWIKPVN